MTIAEELKMLDTINEWLEVGGYDEDSLFGDRNHAIWEYFQGFFPDLTQDQVARIFQIGVLQAAIYDANEGEPWKATLTKEEILEVVDHSFAPTIDQI